MTIITHTYRVYRYEQKWKWKCCISNIIKDKFHTNFSKTISACANNDYKISKFKFSWQQQTLTRTHWNHSTKKKYNMAIITHIYHVCRDEQKQKWKCCISNIIKDKFHTKFSKTLWIANPNGQNNKIHLHSESLFHKVIMTNHYNYHFHCHQDHNHDKNNPRISCM